MLQTHRHHCRVSPTFCDRHQPSATVASMVESRVRGRGGGLPFPIGPRSPARRKILPRRFLDQHRPVCAAAGEGLPFEWSWGAGLNPSHDVPAPHQDRRAWRTPLRTMHGAVPVAEPTRQCHTGRLAPTASSKYGTTGQDGTLSRYVPQGVAGSGAGHGHTP
jgi:hypothetical protein